MTVTLSTETERIVAEKIISGAYQSVDDIVASGVRLLDAKEKGVEALRQEIMRGFDDIQEGRLTTLSSDEEVDAFSDEIIRQANARRDASKK